MRGLWSILTHLRVSRFNACLDCEHVEIDLILPERGYPLPLEAVIGESRQLERAQHFRLEKERIEKVLDDFISIYRGQGDRQAEWHLRSKRRAIRTGQVP